MKSLQKYSKQSFVGIIIVHTYESDVLRGTSERYMVKEVGQSMKQFYSASKKQIIQYRGSGVSDGLQGRNDRSNLTRYPYQCMVLGSGEKPKAKALIRF